MASDLPMVSVSTGVMNSLVLKLVNNQISFLEKAQKEVAKLKDELEMIHAVLRKFAVRDDPDVQVTEWMRQVREVSYDTEDYIDLYIKAQQARRYPPGEKAGSKGKRLLLWRPRKRATIVMRIKELTERIKEANKRREAYKLDPKEHPFNLDAIQQSSRPSTMAVDCPLLVAEAEDEEGDNNLVGLGERLRNLLEKLNDVDQPKQLKVVSIVGVGGIGKTTLASEVFRTYHSSRFDCRAFVKVGRNLSMKVILLTILDQVTRQQNADMEEQDVMKCLKEYLGNKRYLVILDDIRSTSAWKVIKCALPEGICGSRIIITTRSKDVAESCTSHTYVMVPLNEDDSMRLFLTRIISLCKEPGSGCLNVDFCSILKACGGVPLAIVVTAGLLARKYSELFNWDEVNRYAMSSLQYYQTLQGMRRILHFSYSGLTLAVKTCFLYLSSFPENHMIEKDRLIWRWIAEGFIPTGGGGSGTEESMWRKGENCFNELMSRSLIQPVFSTEGDEQVGCMVHGVVMDFILSMSRDENFIMVDASFLSMPPGVIRRLSLNCSKQEDDDYNLVPEMENVNLAHVRSLTVFGNAGWLMPLLENFQLLRVLDLQDANKLEDCNLHCVGSFFHLRYLGLGGGDGVIKLPKEIGELHFLETLDVRKTSVKELPGYILRQGKLARLLARDISLRDGMEKMSELEEIHMVTLTDMGSLRRLTKLMRLRRLRILGVNCRFDQCTINDDNDTASFTEELVSSLSTLGKSSVECLLLHAGNDTNRSLDLMVDSWVAPYLLHRFVMTSSGYFFPGVPQNMGKQEHLAHLTIAIAQLGDKDLEILRNLPALVVLKLHTRVSAPTPTTITSQGFPGLKVFMFECQDGGMGLVFGEGAMPKVWDLQFRFQAREETKFLGINYLCSLRQFQATIDCDGAGDLTFKTAEETIKEFMLAHPKKPSFNVIKHYKDKKVIQSQDHIPRQGSKRVD